MPATNSRELANRLAHGGQPLIVIPLIDLTAIVTKEIQKARYGTPVTMTH